MRKRFVVATVLNWLVAGTLLGVGVDFVTSSRLKPHHERILDVPWSDLTPRCQTLMLTLMKGTGLVAVSTAVSLAVLLAVPFRRREPWSRGAILLVAGTTLVPTLVGALRVRAETGVSPPWWPHVVLLLMLAVAFGLTSERGNKTPSFYTTRTFFRLFYHSILRRWAIARCRRPRLSFCLAFFTLFPLVELFNAVCMLLDVVFFPRCRNREIREPVFVIGNGRSGTTIFHRMMARDEERFFCFRTWEIMFPSVIQKKFLSAVGKLDRLLGGHGRTFIERWEARRFEEFNRMHQMGLFLPEEDSKLLAHILAAADLAFFFPYGEFDKIARLDVTTDAETRRSILEFYIRCVRRQAQFKGGRGTLLSKNPWFTGKVQSLLDSFPDCKVIYLVRNPLDVVASTISIARAILRQSVGLEPEADLDEHVYDLVKFYYSYPLERLASLPEDRFAVVKYEELIREPKQVVEDVYEQFGLTLSPEFAERLDEEEAKMRQYKSSHKYSLDRCSVTRERIVSDLRPVFERFGYATEEVSQHASDVPLRP